MLLRAVLDRDLELAVDHLADMLQHSRLRSGDLDAERQVILEEIHMHEDSPEEVVHDLFTETVWPHHPLGRPVLGTADTIKAATRRRSTGSTGALRPGSLVVAAPATSVTTTCSAARPAWTPAGSFGTGTRGDGPCGRGRTRPCRRPAPLVKRRKTEQAHICLGTNGLARSDPTGSRSRS